VYKPPLMDKVVTASGVYISPINENWKKMNAQRKPLSRTIMNECVKSLVDHIVDGLKERGVSKMQPLTIGEAVNGSDVDAYLRRINASTGAGYGFKGKKSKFLPLVDEKEPIRELDDYLKGKVLAKLEEYEKEVSSGTVFSAKLKDEPRLLEKVLKGKTRAFFPAPLDAYIASKMVLGPFFTLMVQFNDLFGCSVGINMYSEGEKFYKEMEEFIDDGDLESEVEGDYGGFDTNNPYEIGLGGSSVIYQVCKRMGYNDRALRQLKGALSDNLFPIIEWNGDYAIIAGLMTSGGYGTAEFNCIRNILLLMYYFASHPKLTLNDFHTKFLKRTYGDDMAGVVKAAIKPFFNNVLYARFCKEVYGMDYTTATKGAVSKPFNSVKDMSFLKRTFHTHPENGNIVACLDMESIYRMLLWKIPSNSISQLEQMVATCNSALWETFMHVDKATFEQFRMKLITGMQQHFDVNERDFHGWYKICKTLCPNATALKGEEVPSDSEPVGCLPTNIQTENQSHF